MRQLGTLSDPANARTLANYLQSRSIDTRLEQVPEGTVVWVCDEDRVAQARQEYQEFVLDPIAERFRVTLPPRAEPPPEAAPRRRVRSGSHWAAAPERQLTMTLIVGSILATLLFHSAPQRHWVASHLFITTVAVNQTKEFRWFPGLDELREGEVWRALTPMFIHFGPWHLLFNMLWLFSLGSQIERRSGTLWFGVLVVLIAASSNLCQYFFTEVALDPNTWRPVVTRSSPAFGGMSGVVFGLFGYVWMKAVYEPGCGLNISATTIYLMLVWLLICMTGQVGPIANTAHVVGLIVGMLSGFASAWWHGYGQKDARD